jgi:hypothetical protein
VLLQAKVQYHVVVVVVVAAVEVVAVVVEEQQAPHQHPRPKKQQPVFLDRLLRRRKLRQRLPPMWQFRKVLRKARSLCVAVAVDAVVVAVAVAVVEVVVAKHPRKVVLVPTLLRQLQPHLLVISSHIGDFFLIHKNKKTTQFIKDCTKDNYLLIDGDTGQVIIQLT